MTDSTTETRDSTKMKTLAAGDYHVIKGGDTLEDNDNYYAILNPKRSDGPKLTAEVNPHETPDDCVWDAGRAGGVQRSLGPETKGVETETLAETVDRVEDNTMLKQAYCTALVAEIYAGGIDAREIIGSVEDVNVEEAADMHRRVTQESTAFETLKDKFDV